MYMIIDSSDKYITIKHVVKRNTFTVERQGLSYFIIHRKRQMSQQGQRRKITFLEIILRGYLSMKRLVLSEAVSLNQEAN